MESWVNLVSKYRLSMLSITSFEPWDSILSLHTLVCNTHIHIFIPWYGILMIERCGAISWQLLCKTRGGEALPLIFCIHVRSGPI